MFSSIGKHRNPAINEIATSLLNNLQNSPFSGEVYVGYPIFYDPISCNEVKIDILVVSYSGVIIINCINDIALDYTSIQDRLYNKVDSKLRNYDFLLKKRNLMFKIGQITYSTKKIDAVEDYPIAFSNQELYEQVVELFTDTFTEEQYSNILSAFQEAYGISKRTYRPDVVPGTKSELVNNMEKIIERYDRNQMEAILSDPVGVQRIRGMAGSGKTVILARKAVELHTKYPEWDIVVTFNTWALKKQITALVEKFYSIKNNGKKPDYKKLHIMNTWGSSRNPGLYYEICNTLEEECLTFSQARATYGKNNVFEKVCGGLLKSPKLPQKIYDCILIDEAQDFGSNFFKLCLSVLDHKRRLVYAYDELQNINEQTMKSPEEIFGFQIQNDTPLVTTYRNQSSVIVSAHAIGMGLYREAGLIQIPGAPDVWASIGYESENGITPGREVTLYRPAETSPDFLKADISSLITVQDCQSLDNQFEMLCQKIIYDLEQEHLVNTDIMIIDMDSIGHEGNKNKLKSYLDSEGLSGKFQVHLAGAAAPEDFFRASTFPPSIVYTSINRAKGNEAYQVYIINAQKCANSLSAMRDRNALFTAITRSKGWVSILGYGYGMDELVHEFEIIKENEFKLHFKKYPTDEEIKDLVRNNKDIAKQDQTILDNARKVIEDISNSKVDSSTKLKIAMELFGASSMKELMDLLQRDDAHEEIKN